MKFNFFKDCGGVSRPPPFFFNASEYPYRKIYHYKLFLVYHNL
jgi:hypothetical protein